MSNTMVRVSGSRLVLGILVFAWTCLIGAGFPVTGARAEALQFDTLDIRPYGFETDDGLLAGNLYEIANAIAAEADIEIDNSLVPLSRVIMRIKNNRPMCTIVIRSGYSGKISVPVANIHIDLHAGVIPRKGIKLKTYDDLDGLIIGLARGTYIEHPFDSDETLQKHFLDGDLQAVKMLQMERVDAVAGGLSALKYNMKSIGMALDTVEEPLILVKRVFWLHCAKTLQDGNLFEHLRSATERLHKRGKIREIWQEYEK